MDNPKRRASVKQYILITFIFLVIIPTLIAFFLIIHQLGLKTINNSIAQKIELLSAVNENIVGQLLNFKDMTMLIYYNDDTMKYISSGAPKEEDNAELQKILNGMVNSEKYLSAAAITIGERVYNAGHTYQNFDEYIENNKQIIIDQKGRTVWLPTENFITTYGMKCQNFVLARAINSPEGSIGILWLFISERIFLNNVQNHYRGFNSDLYIIDSNNSIISSTNRNSVTLNYSLDRSQYKIQKDGNAILFDALDANGDFIVSQQCDLTNWKIIDVTDKASIYMQQKNIKRLGVFIFLFYFLFIIGTYIALSRMVFNPLSHLSKGLLRVSQGDFSVILKKKRNDEIGELVDSYNTMLRKIDELMISVRKEEQAKTEQKIKVLSMQIGPHFVFNTLNTIKWLAVINKQTNIKRMIECLIELMMSVTYNTNEEIKLREELKLVESYCYIQKARYMNFDLECQVDEEFLDYKVNKLILQPIIENSILYGFDHTSENGKIIITCKITDYLELIVSDNGNGFDTNNIDEILKKEQKDLQHIGLKNVDERIRLCHGPQYGMTIKSQVGAGTEINLRLPILS